MTFVFKSEDASPELARRGTQLALELMRAQLKGDAASLSEAFTSALQEVLADDELLVHLLFSSSALTCWALEGVKAVSAAVGQPVDVDALADGLDRVVSAAPDGILAYKVRVPPRLHLVSGED